GKGSDVTTTDAPGERLRPLEEHRLIEDAERPGAPTMSTDADLPPYEPARILGAPFPERVRLVCRTWAAQVNPTPLVVMALYWVKYLLLYAGGWAFFVSFSAGYPGL